MNGQIPPIKPFTPPQIRTVLPPQVPQRNDVSRGVNGLDKTLFSLTLNLADEIRRTSGASDSFSSSTKAT